MRVDSIIATNYLDKSTHNLIFHFPLPLSIIIFAGHIRNNSRSVQLEPLFLMK